jgi:hypothetical protein
MTRTLIDLVSLASLGPRHDHISFLFDYLTSEGCKDSSHHAATPMFLVYEVSK